MKKTFFTILLSAVLLHIYSCKNESKVPSNDAKVQVSEGLYVNQSLLDALNDSSILWDMPRLGEQITIIKGDTIEVDNFVEKGRFPFSYVNDSVFKIDPLLYGAAFTFHIKSDSELHLIDTLNNKDGSSTSFIKSEKPFSQLLNKKFVAGNYIDEKSKVKNTIIFGADGSIKNWDYIGYELCYAGDCAEMPAVPANIIVLNSEKGIEFMVFKVEKKVAGRYITFHKLEAGDPDEKGNMEITNDSIVLKNIY